MVEHELMTVKELEAYIHIDEKTIYRMAKSGKIPHYRLGSDGGLIRFKRDEIDEWLKQKAVGSKQTELDQEEDKMSFEKVAAGIIMKHRETAALVERRRE